MIDSVRDDGTGTGEKRRRAAAYRCAAARTPLRAQVERALTDLMNLSVLSSRQDRAGARGAALALAQTALVLAVTSASAEDDLRRRATILRETILPALGSAGLGHLGILIEAALVHEGDLAGKAAGVETRQ